MENTTTYTSPYRPFFLRLPNALEEFLNRRGKSLVDFSSTSCIREACRKTGLTTFDDLDFRQPLAMLIQSCRQDARLTFAGKMFVRVMIVKTLMNRLKIEKYIKDNPDILKHPIIKPMVILGLPRTGTTLLHNLLAQDPNSRFLRCWEAMAPAPPPKARRFDTDMRIWSARFLLGLKKYLSPEMSTVKPITAKGAEECIILLGHTFLSYRAFSIFLNNPEYINWLKSQDLTPVYRYYYRILQLLQWHYSKSHWVLKAPEHLINLQPLLTVFPDACLIQTHRDLTAAVPSSCSMVAVFRGSYSNFVDLADIGKTTLGWMADAIDNAMAVRKQHSAERFFDVHYQDLVRDPIETVHRIYEYFGYSCSPDMDQRMRAWLLAHPRHKKGVHRYTLSQFNLDKTHIQQRFRTYYKTYQVPFAER